MTVTENARTALWRLDRTSFERMVDWLGFDRLMPRPR